MRPIKKLRDLKKYLGLKTTKIPLNASKCG